MLNMRDILWLCAVAFIFYLFYALASIMLPFVAGFILAYLLDPLVDRLEAHGLPRLAATSLIMAVFIAVLISGAVFALPAMAVQILLLADVLPQYADKAHDWAAGFSLSGQSTKMIENVSNDALAAIFMIGQGLLLRSLSFLNVLALIVIMPIVAFYMLNDWDKMLAHINRHLPANKAVMIRHIASATDEVLTGFLRGQAIVCLILALFYAVGLWLIGLEGGIVAGLLAGFISFIPYIGALFGLVLAGTLSLVQFWPDWHFLAMVGVLFAVGQFIEGNFLTPHFIGNRVRLHPVWIMFALLAFGALFGFLGLLLAVPLAAVIGVVVRYAIGADEKDQA